MVAVAALSHFHLLVQHDALPTTASQCKATERYTREPYRSLPRQPPSAVPATLSFAQLVPTS